MSTIVDLYIGATGTPETPTATTYELVLENGYTAPSPYLLVLRSAPDIARVDGDILVTESRDTVSFQGRLADRPATSSGTFPATEARDTGSFAGEFVPGAITGTIGDPTTATEPADTAAFTGSYDGIAVRSGALIAQEHPDNPGLTTFQGAFSPNWVATFEATEPADIATFAGEYLDFVFTGEHNGFLNTTHRTDIAGFVGRSVYDVTGEIEAEGVLEAGDVAVFEGRTGQAFEESHTDVVQFSDAIDGAASVQSLVDRIRFTDTIRSDTEFLEDVVGFADALTSRSRISGPLTDTVGFTDTARVIAYGVSADAVRFSDPLGSVVDAPVLEDALRFTDTATSDSVLTAALSDTGYVTDTVESLFLASTTDTLTFADTLDGTLAVYAALADVATFADEAATSLAQFAELSDTGGFADELGSSLALVGVLADTVLFGDSLSTAAETLYVVNADTGAVSTYVLTPTVRGLTQFRGVLYLAGPEGLYALDADQDEDGGVVWTLRTGFSNLGTDKLKRVQDANFQARTEGDTTFQVVSDRYGQKQAWNYRLPPLTRDSYRDGVVKPGKGIQSVYWQFAAQGIGPAEIDQVRLVVESLSRRR